MCESRSIFYAQCKHTQLLFAKCPAKGGPKSPVKAGDKAAAEKAAKEASKCVMTYKALRFDNICAACGDKKKAEAESDAKKAAADKA